jgi:hypothetical protein
MTATDPVAALLAEIGHIGLGVALCDALEAFGVGIAADAGRVQAVGGDEAFGFYAPRDNMIYLKPGQHPAVLLHVLLHEARHALQICGLRGALSKSAIFNLNANPQHFAVNMRAREIDADLFAVYFLYAHAAEAGSRHFDDMQAAADRSIRDLERSHLYAAFYDAWAAKGGSHDDRDVLPAMGAVIEAWIATPQLTGFYDTATHHQWGQLVVPVFRAALTDPQSRWRAAVAAHARLAPDAAGAACRDAVAFYATLLNEAGYPDYLQNVTAGDYLDHMLQKAPLKSDIALDLEEHGRAVAHIRRHGLARRLKKP